jgi:hypothetical protein
MGVIKVGMKGILSGKRRERRMSESNGNECKCLRYSRIELSRGEVDKSDNSGSRINGI